VIRRTATALLVLMVYVQGAFAASLCTSQAHSAAVAIAQSDAPPCHETSDQRPSPNLCVAHCENQSQSLDKPSVGVHALPAIPVLRVSLPNVVSKRAATAFEVAASGAPPPLFRFTVLLQ
jgi:hypothetical protein